MNPPTFTADEARLLLDHLDNVQAASLPDDEYKLFRAAKVKLLSLELLAELEQGRAAA